MQLLEWLLGVMVCADLQLAVLGINYIIAAFHAFVACTG